VTAPPPFDRKALSVALARNAWMMAQDCSDERTRASLLRMADHWTTQARLQDSIGSALKPESLTRGASHNICVLQTRYDGQWEKADRLAWRERHTAR
jgi:hypothetical protein